MFNGKIATDQIVYGQLSLFVISTEKAINVQKRLIIVLQSNKGANQYKEVQCVVFIEYECSPPDALTKVKKVSFILGTVVSLKLLHLTEQWIERRPLEMSTVEKRGRVGGQPN